MPMMNMKFWNILLIMGIKVLWRLITTLRGCQEFQKGSENSQQHVCWLSFPNTCNLVMSTHLPWIPDIITTTSSASALQSLQALWGGSHKLLALEPCAVCGVYAWQMLNNDIFFYKKKKNSPPGVGSLGSSLKWNLMLFSKDTPLSGCCANFSILTVGTGNMKWDSQDPKIT